MNSFSVLLVLLVEAVDWNYKQQSSRLFSPWPTTTKSVSFFFIKIELKKSMLQNNVILPTAWLEILLLNRYPYLLLSIKN